MKYILVCTLMSLGVWMGPLKAQSEDPITLFGFFQPQYSHDISQDGETKEGSFTVQQLNLFLQKDLTSQWRGLVNLEFVNSYSSSRQTGSFSLEEAWVRYRRNRSFNLKLGLHLPTFNHLNDIKNRTPLLPYITRPLAYETSLSEIIPVEEYAPQQAYISVYGFTPFKEAKLDYVAYMGNSPNITTTLGGGGISGTDTTSTFLVGGRVGLRWATLNVGASGTLDYINELYTLADQFPELGLQVADLEEVPRVRFGTDVSFDIQHFYFEGEYTRIWYNNLPSVLARGFDFYYALLGYNFSERWGAYAMTSIIGNTIRISVPLENNEIVEAVQDLDIEAWSGGLVFRPSERISIKGQYHWIRIQDEAIGLNLDRFHRMSTAVSIFF